MMDHSRYEVALGIWLDVRRALWLAKPRVLAVADLHIGYAWAHRQTGQLMPITAPDDVTERLMQLCEEYRPSRIVLVGDIVHRAVPIRPVIDEFTRLLRSFPTEITVDLVMGNHDRGLQELAGDSARMKSHATIGNCVFLHGDADSGDAVAEVIRDAEHRKRWIIIGHEHPSVTLSDGAATWEKYPCFLICDRLIVLPAFSRWAAGNSRDDYMSPLLSCKSVELRVAILGDRLVPVAGDQ
jgi:putative SbcD/Mre11-related phosphoesterase